MGWTRRRIARWKLRKIAGVETEAGERLLALADALGYPRQWNVCAFCGKAEFGLHPHFDEVCPLPVALAESAGLNLEASATMNRRAGIQVEEATRLIQELFPRKDPD